MNKDFQPTEAVRSALQSAWTLCTDGPIEWFDRLWKLYSEPSRHYHTPVHLLEMWQFFQLLKADFKLTETQEEAIAWAIFFHDAIYDATSKSNEDDSIRLYREFAQETKLSARQQVTDAVIDYIDATKRHVVSDRNATSLSLFLDLDMAVLGKAPHAYMAYAALIRKEYKHVPSDVYCTARADVLETFLQQPRIYGTELVRQALEDRARSNIRHEIDSLRRGEIPGEEKRE